MAVIIDRMLATGARIGKILARRWADVALDADRPNSTIGTVRTEPGKSTYRKASPRSDSRVRTVVLPAPPGPQDGGDPVSERVDAETASQQLGHSSPAITREFPISKPAGAADVGRMLEELARPEDA